jgi:outer membrane protein assembly factor BamB/tetratricopeptide (TPR) repeat protein
MGTPLSEHPGKTIRPGCGRWLLSALAGISMGIAAGERQAAGQFPQFLGDRVMLSQSGSRYELAGSVTLEEAEGTVRTYLDRVSAYVADGQLDEAVKTLRQVMEESGSKLVGVTEHRFIPVRDFCQLQLASLPPDGLALYRGQVDPLARNWYEQGIADRDGRPLLDVVNQALASSYGDNALAALGEIALEKGDYAAARSYWEKIIPVDPPPDTQMTWLSAPETDLDLAAIRARLVLASILEGSLDRARDELARFRQLHPGARGWLGGPDVDYAQALSALLAESDAWPPPPVKKDWPTFAGAGTRGRIAPPAIDPGGVAWRLPLRESLAANPSIWGSGAPTPRVAEDAARPLSYHPVLYGNLVLVNNQVEILAVDLATGKPAWGQSTAAIFRDQYDAPVHALYHPPDNLGVPRFTMTVADGRLYARMGPSFTSRPAGGPMAGGTGYLVAIDLASEGRLLWTAKPPDAGWAFEGSPLVDGPNVYAAIRRSDIQPQAHVACLDAETGRLKWRRFVCAAETPARGAMYETTHNLLAMDRQTLYYNTNLGAVAAISAIDGELEWVSLYPRERQGDLLRPSPHVSRDLNPCLMDRGRLYVAPSDSPRIFALDATTGQILWQSTTALEDLVHLLGTSDDQLIAGGDRLYWISLRPDDAGRVTRVWPDGDEKLGYGRGLLAGDCVWWPVRDKIYVLDRRTARLKKAIDLAPRGVGGGNLLVADGRLLIATDDELVAIGEGTSQNGDANNPQLTAAERTIQ